MTPAESIAYIQGITHYQFRDIEILDESRCVWIAEALTPDKNNYLMIIAQQDHYILVDGSALYSWVNKPTP